MDEEARLLERYGRKRPFSVPEGYFEQLQRHVMDEVRQAAPEVSLWMRVRKPLAVAAGVCALVAAGLHYLPDQEEPQTAQVASPATKATSVKEVPTATQTQQAAVLPIAFEREEAPVPQVAEAKKAEPVRTVAPKVVAVEKPQVAEEPQADALDVAADYLMADADDFYAMLVDE